MAEFPKSSEELAPKPEEVESAGGLAPESKEKSVVKLSKPSRELAVRLLGKVSFKDRVVGLRCHPMTGDDDTSIFSFEEAVGFLDVEERIFGKYGWAGIIDPKALKKWIGEILGDEELAQAIGETARELDNCTPLKRHLKKIELVIPMKELMEQRLKQCKEVIGEKTEA